MKRIGFAATYGFTSIEDAIVYAAKNNFSAVEINLNIPEFYPERYSGQDIRRIRKLSDEHNIAVSFHAPEDINLCTKQIYIADASIKRLKECIDFAANLNYKMLTFHIGDSVNFTMYDGNKPLEDYYEEEYCETLKTSIKDLCEYASDRITLCAENTGYFSTAKADAVRSLLGRGLYLTWDIGHSHIKRNQFEFMMENAEYVRNIHLHDVCGIKDHCIIGSGEIDFSHYISLFSDKEVNYIIEVRPSGAAVESYNNLKKLL